MDKVLIFIGSVTKTMRARDLLRDYKIESTVERDSNAKNGCGYGILVVNDNVEYAKSLLNEHGFGV